MKAGSFSYGLLLAAATAGLGGCGSMRLPAEPVAHRVVIGGETYLLQQITDSTWTANAAGGLNALPATSASTAALLQAVESTSGCSVTDSDYSRQGRQFDAQVRCAGSLGN